MSIRAVNWAKDVCARIGVPPQERLILFVICFHHHDKTGECFPSYETISEMTGYRRQRVIEGVNALELNGLVIRQKRRVGGHQGSNHFVLFGRPAATEWQPARVQKKGPCKSTHGGTQPRVRTGGPDREYNTSKGAGPESVALKVIAGGRHA